MIEGIQGLETANAFREYYEERVAKKGTPKSMTSLEAEVRFAIRSDTYDVSARRYYGDGVYGRWGQIKISAIVSDDAAEKALDAGSGKISYASTAIPTGIVANIAGTICLFCGPIALLVGLGLLALGAFLTIHGGILLGLGRSERADAVLRAADEAAAKALTELKAEEAKVDRERAALDAENETKFGPATEKCLTLPMPTTCWTKGIVREAREGMSADPSGLVLRGSVTPDAYDKGKAVVAVSVVSEGFPAPLRAMAERLRGSVTFAVGTNATLTQKGIDAWLQRAAAKWLEMASDDEKAEWDALAKFAKAGPEAQQSLLASVSASDQALRAVEEKEKELANKSARLFEATYGDVNAPQNVAVARWDWELDHLSKAPEARSFGEQRARDAREEQLRMLLAQAKDVREKWRARLEAQHAARLKVAHAPVAELKAQRKKILREFTAN